MAKHKFKAVQSRMSDELDKRSPHLKGMAHALSLTERETDRGMVLILASFLEELMKRLLLGFMVAGTKENDFFEGSSPLATFSSRIKMAFALGLISAEERSDLDIVREIRNAFAHDINANFGEQSVKDQCLSMKYAGKRDGAEIRERFRSGAIVLFISIATRTDNFQKYRRTTLPKQPKTNAVAFRSSWLHPKA